MVTEIEVEPCVPKVASDDDDAVDGGTTGDPPGPEVDYRVDESPPAFLAVLLAFQHYVSMFIATLTIPILLAPAICMGEDNVGKTALIGTLFVMSGVITLLQNIVGCRLPIVQAGTFALMVPTLSYLSLPQWTCPSNIVSQDQIPVNATDNATYIIVGSEEHREIWMTRLREIQGAVMCAALVEVLLGLTGAVGFLLRYIGPLSICPTISLLGLSLFKSAAVFAATQWWISALTILLMVVFSQFLGHVQLPCVGYSRQAGFHRQSYPLLRMFPVILSIAITWSLSAIFTVSGVFTDDPTRTDYAARTDVRTGVIADSPWVRFPYPGQWGTPTVSVSAVFALTAGILATTVESIGDYHACAKLAGAPPPPLHAVNRGILVEGIGTFLDGLFGTGNGTTSTSINVGVVGITKVGSRRVVQISAVFMIVFGVFNKFGAIFVTIPDPVIGGTFFILFGMIVAVGLSNLQYVDLNSSRNLFIIGFSFFAGLSIPQWVSANPDRIHTGSQMVDNICQVLLSTSMFVGGLIGFLLDNSIPGTIEERGLAVWQKSRQVAPPTTAREAELRRRLAACYDLPFGMTFIRRSRFLARLPFSPTFRMPRAVPLAADGKTNGEVSEL